VAFRTFVDSAGDEWQAFDVVPRTSERRRAERRLEGAPIDLDEERREAERRLTVGLRSVSPALKSGWLVFERGAESHRVSPIPENWQRCTDAELEAYLQAARDIDEQKERRG
jgi:hypothetical protein